MQLELGVQGVDNALESSEKNADVATTLHLLLTNHAQKIVDIARVFPKINRFWGYIRDMIIFLILSTRAQTLISAN